MRALVRPSLKAVTALTGAMLLVGGSLAQAGGRADLVASGTKAATSAAVAGGSLQVSTKIANRGAADAGATKAGFYLSKDSKLNKGDAPLGRKATPAIPKGKSKSVSLLGSVPRSLKPANYKVLACADAAKQVRESSESNNCKASSGTVEIVAPYDSTPFGPASPTDVTPTLDESSSVTTRVTASSGGRVVLTRSGITFTLDVPGGALLADQDITMTALSGIAGDPFGGFVAGVQLGPEGLTFEKPATLTIDLTTPVPASREKTFSSESSGDGYHLYPVDVETTDPTFSILHFSNFGVSDSASDASVPNPVDPGAALTQQIRSILQTARDRYLNGGEALTEAELHQIGELGRIYYDKVAKPLLVEALNADKCDGLQKKKKAIITALLWARQMELIGVDGLMGERISEMYDYIGKISDRPCAFPNRLTGTMGGTYTDSDSGLTEEWTASVTFTKNEEYSTSSWAIYDAAGSISWSVSGTDENGCRVEGSGTLGIGEGFSGGSISVDPASYGFQLVKTDAFQDATRSCPGPPPSSGPITYIALNVGDFADTSSHPYSPGSILSGTRTYQSVQDPDVTLTLNWTLNAG